VAQSGHRRGVAQCPLLGAKRTLIPVFAMSASDPKRTSEECPHNVCFDPTQNSNDTANKKGSAEAEPVLESRFVISRYWPPLDDELPLDVEPPAPEEGPLLDDPGCAAPAPLRLPASGLAGALAPLPRPVVGELLCGWLLVCPPGCEVPG
jgi:hypothetical protein